MSSVSNPAPAITPTTTGTYTGNDTANRAIPHGLGSTPSFVFIRNTNSTLCHTINKETASISYIQGPNDYAVTAMNATNFYVGNAASYTNSANLNTAGYQWVALK